MARFYITKNSELLKPLKRACRQSRLQVRYRSGDIFIMKWPEYRDPKSVKQLTCRERFRKAQLLMMDDFCSPSRIIYWQKEAKRLGYKTAKGCARAYYISYLKRMEEQGESVEVISQRRSAMCLKVADTTLLSQCPSGYVKDMLADESALPDVDDLQVGSCRWQGDDG